MQQWDVIQKEARDCHTKQAWEEFFDRHGEALATTSNSKPVADVFRLLKADPQSLQYSANLWSQLIQGCRYSWNLELGQEIATFAQKIPSPYIAVQAAQLYRESGMPAAYREIANRALRLSGTDDTTRVQLELLVCSSYAEEGNRSKAIRALNKIAEQVQEKDLAPKDRAEFTANMGRLQFFLGRYIQAAEFFENAAYLYKDLEDHESAATTLFNAGACLLNGGTSDKARAFAMLEETRRISEAHNLPGPLSHCDAAYGMESYYHGDFAAAKEHLRRALDHLPLSDKSYRRLHIISMLSFTYLSMGRYHLARKFGQQTLDLAMLEESKRLTTRFSTLKAELLWEDGQIDESQKLLSDEIQPLVNRGIHTLEELATVNRYNIQSALLGGDDSKSRLPIDESLRRNSHAWLERQYSLGQLLANANEYDEAEAVYQDCLSCARNEGDRQREALALLGLIQIHLRRRQVDEISLLRAQFDVTVAKIGETPFRSHAQFIHAACAYQTGDYAGAVRTLNIMNRGKHGFVERFCLSGILATIEGRSPRLTAQWQRDMVARMVRTYFAPSLEALDERRFLISGHYEVSLERHPSLAELVHFLLLKPEYMATLEEIQTGVWQESLRTQGWQQKIRNSIMRLRDFFPYTIAPILVHADNVGLYKEAISIQPQRRAGLNTEQEIVRLLQDSPMSSTQLSKRLKISAATTKRLLKRLSEEQEIVAHRRGRNVLYTTASAAPPPA